MTVYPEFISRLQKQLEEQLPGVEAQMEMSVRNRYRLTESAKGATPAAVLISLFVKDDRWHTALIKRKEKAGDRHSGQISLPGGRLEQGESTLEAAVRESYEEIATPFEVPDILGELTPLHIPVSNYLVHPWIAYLQEPGSFRPQLSEVDDILVVPLDTFSRDANKKFIDLNISSGLILRDVPYFDIEGKVVWGATAMIMNEFMTVIRGDSALKSLISIPSGTRLENHG